jgi:transposase-like protein/IS1 family transposase
MNCPTCQTESRKRGKDRKGNQRFYCASCFKSFIEPQDKPLDNMYLPLDKAVQCINLLVEGCSLRTTERITGVSLRTLLNLLILAGTKCEQLLDERIANVPVKDVECDEIWCYVGMKEKTLKTKTTAGKYQDDFELLDKLGDAYTFVGFERNSKLVLAWHLGRRTNEDTLKFAKKLGRATFDDRFQVTTDGFAQYRYAIVRELEHKDIDFAQLIKHYATPEGDERRYSPPVVVDITTEVIFGNPDPARICTSIVERQNLTIRMQMRRFTRLTNAFSKKWENLRAALALFFAFYNFCRPHSSIKKQTPAMAAGLTDHVWSIQELLTAAAAA